MNIYDCFLKIPAIVVGVGRDLHLQSRSTPTITALTTTNNYRNQRQKNEQLKK